MFEKYLMFAAAVDCGLPLSIEQGTFTLNQGTTTYLDTVTYSCESGYDILGPMARYCQADGEWSETEPICQRETATVCRDTICNSCSSTHNFPKACCYQLCSLLL